ncbi:hypothetical protein [Hymenobacter jejuensis]|nr:hypothetical protein [Hymenobacter jejuensis]
MEELHWLRRRYSLLRWKRRVVILMIINLLGIGYLLMEWWFSMGHH